ncbi:HMCN [Mytilus coruscus]|uniref:HMCN n=1 Tax=Mytilus coruscus TaxID=42192 RepID=A0A6J8BJ79_MYTCO|nr:HMCN [Mytilus coruscus]
MEEIRRLLNSLFCIVQCVCLVSKASTPMIIVGKNEYNPDYGTKLVIDTQISASPKVLKVYWTRNSSGIITTIEHGLSGTDGITVDNPALTLLYITDLDNGLYTCIAESYRGIGFSKTVNVTVNGGVPYVKAVNTTYSVLYGNRAVLKCEIASLPELIFVAWEKENNGVLTVLNSGAVGTKGIRKSDPSLIIPSTSFYDSGNYTCIGCNSAGIGKSNPISLRIHGEVPSVTIPTMKYNVEYGGEVTLQCFVNSRVTLQNIYWEKSANGLIKAINQRDKGTRGISLSNPSLTIAKVTLADIGEYTCIASNAVGTVRSVKISLTTKGGLPQVTVGATAYDVVYGNRITLQCSVSSDPEANLIYWQKEVKGVFSTLSHNSFGTNGMTPNNPSLTIESATLNDSGAYLCSAVNTVGTSSSQWTILSVTGALPVVTTDSPTYFIEYGENITLPCSVVSTPVQTNVYWEKTVDDRYTFIYSGTPGTHGISLSSPSLTIDSVVESDNGNYTCVAINSLGITQSMTSSLTVLGASPEVSVNQENYTVNDGSSALLQCEIQSNIPYHHIYWEQNINGKTTILLPGMIGISGITLEDPYLRFDELHLQITLQTTLIIQTSLNHRVYQVVILSTTIGVCVAVCIVILVICFRKQLLNKLLHRNEQSFGNTRFD